MFTMTGNKDHSTRKKMLSNIYSKSFLQSSPHVQLISKTILFEHFLPIIQEAASSNTPINMYEINQAVTMDFVSAYLFGLANGTKMLQDRPLRERLLPLYHSRKPFEFYDQEVPNLTSLLHTFGVRLIPEWCDEANRILGDWALKMYNKAARSVDSNELDTEPVVFKQLQQSIAKKTPTDKKNPSPAKEETKKQRLEIACELYDHLTAGFETSAAALTYLLWELSKDSDVQKALHEELLTLNPKIASSSSGQLPSPKSIDALPLLDAVFMETLRLHASIPGMQPRVTPNSPCSLAGYNNIPPGTRVNAQAYSLHRNSKVFPDPETWEPKRWLRDTNSSADLEERKRWFWAFGSGGRMCIGSNLALQGKSCC